METDLMGQTSALDSAEGIEGASGSMIGGQIAG